MYCLTPLEATRSRSRSHRVGSFRGLRGGVCVPSSGVWWFPGNARRHVSCRSTAPWRGPSSSHAVLCVQIPPFGKDASCTGLGPHLLQGDRVLTLANYVSNNPTSNKVTCRGAGIKDSIHELWGDRIQPTPPSAAVETESQNGEVTRPRSHGSSQ